ncbi:hypothetical protein CEXT_796381 [Caerostris extrusa]|uniref:Uncharacterized protein n=1 Tax=Caerostris extrusa TaxID=172846 RepID=A0AAV4TH73_CAEEX|nr:hypothetical protein CEXT_796381 [Caerostris extrusa]
MLGCQESNRNESGIRNKEFEAILKVLNQDNVPSTMTQQQKNSGLILYYRNYFQDQAMKFWQPPSLYLSTSPPPPPPTQKKEQDHIEDRFLLHSHYL